VWLKLLDASIVFDSWGCCFAKTEDYCHWDWICRLVTAACLASVGHDIMGLDKDESKIRLLKQGRSPIYEAGLESLIKQSLSKEPLLHW